MLSTYESERGDTFKILQNILYTKKNSLYISEFIKLRLIPWCEIITAVTAMELLDARHPALGITQHSASCPLSSRLIKAAYHE